MSEDVSDMRSEDEGEEQDAIDKFSRGKPMLIRETGAASDQGNFVTR